MFRKSFVLALIVFGAAFVPLFSAPQAAQAGFGCNTWYNVQRGETLSQIARRHGFTVSQLAAINGITNPNRIYVGQALCLGYRADVGGQTHVVQAGDTLSRIARRYGVSMTVLARVNNIANPNRIYVGQTLSIPDVTIQTGQ